MPDRAGAAVERHKVLSSRGNVRGSVFRHGWMPRINMRKSEIQIHSNHKLSGSLEKQFTEFLLFVKVMAKDHKEPSPNTRILINAMV